MIDFFVAGGVMWMTFLTLELVGVLLAAFKAPRWVRPIGNIVLWTGLLSTLFGLLNVFGVLMYAGDVSPTLIYGGCRGSLIPIIYSILIFVASRIIAILQTPRI